MTQFRSLDLRGTACPVNFIRCKLTLETLQMGELLDVMLDRGEPEAMVLPGLRREGHNVVIVEDHPTWILLRAIRGG